MEFKGVLKNLEKGRLIIGNNHNSKLVIDIESTPSVIITGETGTGKSILLDQILLELISTHNSMEMGIISIDTSGVELTPYVNSNYSLFSAINDIDKSEEAIFKILREMERRKALLNSKQVLNVYDYNKMSKSKLPLLVLAIDDDKLLLRNNDLDKMISGIISECYGLNIFVVIATSDVYSKFFTSDNNTLASLLISFDYTSDEDASNINIEGTNDLPIGTFKAKLNNTVKEYKNFDFDDKLINEILNN